MIKRQDQHVPLKGCSRLRNPFPDTETYWVRRCAVSSRTLLGPLRTYVCVVMEHRQSLGSSPLAWPSKVRFRVTPSEEDSRGKQETASPLSALPVASFRPLLAT